METVLATLRFGERWTRDQIYHRASPLPGDWRSIRAKIDKAIEGAKRAGFIAEDEEGIRVVGHGRAGWDLVIRINSNGD